jgi:predicted permease
MRATAIYRALLHCYPAAFRHEYGGQMLLMFSEQLRNTARSGSRLERAALWARVIRDAVTIAPREHAHVIHQDTRYAIRTMTARPTFAVVAILSLVLGIGANTAMFSLWNGILRAPLPLVDKPQELVMLSNPDDAGMWTGTWDGRTDGPRSWLTYEEFEQLRDHADSFSMLMASQSSLIDWQVRFGGGPWEQARGRLVSGEFFHVLGVAATLGRVFTPAEDRAGSPSVVISYSYWQRRFGGRTDVLGQTVTIRRLPLTIVGVTPRGFIGETVGQQPDLWMPSRLQPSVIPGNDWLHDTPPSKAMWLHVFGRLKPGVTKAQAETEANTIFRAGLQSFYGAVSTGRRRDYLDQQLRLGSGARGASSKRNQFSQSLTALLAGVGVLLLIACANLANLLLARGTARRPELALRLFLGASRERVMRQLVTESVLLAVIGCVAGVAVAGVLHAALVRMLAESDPRFQIRFGLDATVLAFTLAATFGAVLLFGVLPAWQVTGPDAGASLTEAGRGLVGSRRQMRWGRALVSLQLALCYPLVVGAGLMAQTVNNLQRVDLGFPAERLLLVRVELHEAGYDNARRVGLLDELLAEIQRIPGVRSAGFSQLGLFGGGESSTTVAVEGYAPKGDRDRSSAMDVVGPAYFSTLGIRVPLGRAIDENDRGDTPKVCVINEAFARQFFDGRNPIGMRVTSVDDDLRTDYRVVGVARDARTKALQGEVRPRYFVAGQQAPAAEKSPTLLIRTAGDSASLLTTVRKTIERVDAALPITSARSIEEQMAPLTAQDRTTARLAVVFGCVALALAAIGLYGVLSYGISRRTGEIAIRIALGAQAWRVIAMILGESAGLIAAGLALGGGLAYAGTRLLGSRLYGIAPQDPPTFVVATGLLLLVAFNAAYLPASRASRLDPITSLRQQ